MKNYPFKGKGQRHENSNYLYGAVYAGGNALPTRRGVGERDSEGQLGHGMGSSRLRKDLHELSLASRQKEGMHSLLTMGHGRGMTRLEDDEELRPVNYLLDKNSWGME
ncbi:hypothetical protein CRG98_026980 [Punica granatum]|uniref:Uncharacterized protein n=1 Tax=Punica granatum TaxID=22663 RepID=A0A2I0J9S8_PUNGR|nr:hypothetical protein CRG98_026980 [Punica granatum]